MMEQRHHRLNDKGYSLVEMIICIAIIAIMTGVAVVTVSLINSAKAREASVTFTSELSDMYTKSKNQMVVISDVKYPKYNHCLYLHSDGTRTYIKKGYYNPAGTDEATKYIYTGVDTPNSGKGVSITSSVTIKYKDSAGVEKSITGTDSGTSLKGVYIIYDRNGRCIEGSGLYTFCKDEDVVIAEVGLKKNGSYQSN